MLQALKRFFWPSFPAQISEESADALRADLKAAGVWGQQVDQTNQNAVDVWVRHSDNMNRANNREWLRPQAKVFALHWGVLSAVLWLSAWIASADIEIREAGVLTSRFSLTNRPQAE